MLCRAAGPREEATQACIPPRPVTALLPLLLLLLLAVRASTPLTHPPAPRPIPAMALLLPLPLLLLAVRASTS